MATVPGSHLLSLGAELGLGLELLGQDVLLLHGLLVLPVQVLDELLVRLELILDISELGLLLNHLLVVLRHLLKKNRTLKLSLGAIAEFVTGSENSITLDPKRRVTLRPLRLIKHKYGVPHMY